MAMLIVTRRDHRRVRNWRKQIRIRDQFTCQLCRNPYAAGHVHHILQWAKYPDLRTELWNGIYLCKSCHESLRNREELIAFHLLQLTMGGHENG